MQWCLCGQPGASTCQAQPVSSPASLPSLPVFTTRSSTSAWAPNFARIFWYFCRARKSTARWCTCKTSRQKPRPRPRLNHFQARSWKWKVQLQSWTNLSTTVIRGSTALLRLLRLTHRSSTSTCPLTLKHQSTGVTGSEDCFHFTSTNTWILWGDWEYLFIYFFVCYGLIHLNKLYVQPVLINYFKFHPCCKEYLFPGPVRSVLTITQTKLEQCMCFLKRCPAHEICSQ